jgi:hypothetical protein
VRDERAVTEPDVQRYLVGGSAAGPQLTLRGHEMFIPRLLQVLGVICLLGAAAGIYGVVTSPGDPIPLGIAIAGGVLGVGFVAYARYRLAHPSAVLVIDKTAQTLTVRRGLQPPVTIAFRDLGPMKLGKVTAVIAYGHTGGRERVSHAVIGLSRHEGLILYDPFTAADMARFAVTLRHIIGEEFLPRAQPKPSPSPAGTPP